MSADYACTKCQARIRLFIPSVHVPYHWCKKNRDKYAPMELVGETADETSSNVAVLDRPTHPAQGYYIEDYR